MRKYKNHTLDEFQLKAFAVIDDDESVFVAAPTGAGKTLIADYAIEKAMEKNMGVVYTAPVKALSNQKYRDFKKTYGDQNVGILTGDVSINPSAPIMVMTTEIFRNVLLTEPNRVKNIAWLIFDEVHYIDDYDRGTVWEESIMLKPPHLKILGLSATVPNVGTLAGWIKKLHDQPVQVIREEKRPVPLHFFFQCNNHIYDSIKDLDESKFMLFEESRLRRARYRERHLFQHKKNRIDSLFTNLKEENKLPVIYFVFSRRKCETLAEELMEFDFLSDQEQEILLKEYNRLLKIFDIQKDKTAMHMGKLIAKGIAYHHAGLLPTLKEVVEQLFTSKLLKVIFTTETFALGVNMPARSVVFDDTRKFYGTHHANLKTRDFYQMAGRAGRRGIDTEGNVIVRINPLSLSLQELRRIIHGKTEPVISQFSSNYATLLNLFKEMGDKILDIYPSSFHFYQSDKKEQKTARWLLKAKLNVLREMDYIATDKVLTWKGELASRSYSYELQLGELYERGMLESLTSRELAVLICALVYEPRKGVRAPEVPPDVKNIKRGVDKVVRSIQRVEKHYDLFPLAKGFSFHLSRSMYMWLDGAEFDKILEDTDFDEGEVVRYFRMTIQVLRELKSFKAFDADFKNKVDQALDGINRGVIDAEKQLRQEI